MIIQNKSNWYSTEEIGYAGQYLCTDGTYLYCRTTDYLLKIRISDMSLYDQANIVVGAMLYNNGYLYVVVSGNIYKIDPSDLSIIATYTNANYFFTSYLATDGTYIYASIYKAISTAIRETRIVKIQMSDMSEISYYSVSESNQNVFSNLTADSSYVYEFHRHVYGVGTPYYTIDQIKTSDMTLNQSWTSEADFNLHSKTLIVVGDYLYATFNITLRKIQISDMTTVLSMDLYDISGTRTIIYDGTSLWFGSNNLLSDNDTVQRRKTSDLTQETTQKDDGESNFCLGITSYGTKIYASYNYQYGKVSEVGYVKKKCIFTIF